MTVDQQAEFKDWSPASIFGPTTSTKVASEPPLSQSYRNDFPCKSTPGSKSSLISSLPSPQSPKRKIWTPVSTTEEGKRRESLKVRVVSINSTISEEIGAQLARDYAARTIQKHLRVHQLYCQEKASTLHVFHLRQVLMGAAATQLQRWYRQCHKRHGLLIYLTEFHRMEGRIAYLLDQTLQKKTKIIRERILKQKEKRQRVDQEKKMIQETIHRKARAFIAMRKLRFFFYMLLMSKRYARATAAKRKHQYDEQLAQWQEAAATKIQLQYRNYHARRLLNMKRARREQIYLGLLRLEDILKAHRKKQTTKKWWDFILFCRHQKKLLHHHQQQEAAARVLQRSFRLQLARIQREKIRKQNERQHSAAIVIQKQWHGFFTRKKIQAYLLKLRNQFTCSNCGFMEPGGGYCKNCGRKRVNGTGLVPERLIQRYHLGSLVGRRSKVAFSSALTTKPNTSSSLFETNSFIIGRNVSPRIQKAKLKLPSSNFEIQKLKRPPVHLPLASESMSNNRYERELELQEMEKQKKNQMFGLSPTKIGSENSTITTCNIPSMNKNRSNLDVVGKTKERVMDLNDSRSIVCRRHIASIRSQMKDEQYSLALLQHLKRLEKNQQVITRNSQW